MKYFVFKNWIKFILSTFIFLLTSCTTTYIPPETSPSHLKTFQVAKDIEYIWTTVIKYFAGKNIPIENLDHSSYFIKTKAPLFKLIENRGISFNGDRVPLRNEWCDCGVAKIGNVWETSTRISVSYNIVLTKIESGKTEITINVFFDGSYLGRRQANTTSWDVEIPLNCHSSGKFERALIDFINNHS